MDLSISYLAVPTVCTGGELHGAAMECMLELVATSPRHTIQGLLLDTTWVKVGGCNYRLVCEGVTWVVLILASPTMCFTLTRFRSPVFQLEPFHQDFVLLSGHRVHFATLVQTQHL